MLRIRIMQRLYRQNVYTYIRINERTTAFETALRCTRNSDHRYKVYIEPLNHGNNILEHGQKASRNAEEDILKSKIQKVIRNYRRIGRLFRRPVH